MTDTRLDQVRELAEGAQDLADDPVIDPEKVKKNSDNLIKAKVLLDQVRTENLKTLRERELRIVQSWYEEEVEPFCDEVQKSDMKSMIGNLERLISRKSKDFETLLGDIYGKGFWGILFAKSERFVASVFTMLRSRPYSFKSREAYHSLVQAGEEAIAQSDFDELRHVVLGMYSEQKQSIDMSDMSAAANIMRS